MSNSRSAAYGLSAVVALALLAACGDSSSRSAYAATGVSPTSAQRRPDYHKSWVPLDESVHPRLLFVSDRGRGAVYIYTMPGLRREGTLTGFSGLLGVCNDSSGNIWIVDGGTSQVFQYSRTGTLLKTIDDPGFEPFGCAVNSTGDVAVANGGIMGRGSGNVSVFHNGSGSPTILTNPDQRAYDWPAYDTSGNLYVDGRRSNGEFILSECPAGKSSCHTLTVSGASPHVPGGLNWDKVNNDLIIGDVECEGRGHAASCLYAATISGSTAMVTGMTKLYNFDGTHCYLVQGALAPFSKYFAGTCRKTNHASETTVDRWAYPAGGLPGSHATGLELPVGAAISNK
jgi:DNA-binding beta-propeller fold protein YncE